MLRDGGASHEGVHFMQLELRVWLLVNTLALVTKPTMCPSMNDTADNEPEKIMHRARVLDFLNHYACQLVHPGYAVMLEGPWGSGKTWLVKKFAGALDRELYTCYYVSLYGVRSASDIVEQLYQQINPILGNPKVQKSLSVLRSVMKSALKINLDGEEKGSLELSPPELSKSVNVKNAILIFDDLERCAMPLNETFGLINQFVEHDGNRVILLANPLNFTTPEAAAGFKTMREKLIGRSFTIPPDPKSALLFFLRDLEADCGRILGRRLPDILAIFDRANYANLRELRQALVDFSDLWHCLPVDHRKRDPDHPFWGRLVHDVVSLSIELRAGGIFTHDLHRIHELLVDLSGRQGYARQRPTSSTDRFIRHGMSDGTRYAFPVSTYLRFFTQGFLSEEESMAAAECSPYLLDASRTPEWIQLWFWEQLSDEAFADLLARAFKRYTDLDFTTEEEFLHLTAQFLYFDTLGVVGDLNVRSMALDAIENLRRAKRIPAMDYGPGSDALAPQHLPSLLPLWGGSSDNFQTFRSHYLQARHQADDQALSRLGERWLDEFEGDVAAWASRIDRDAGSRAYLSGYQIFTSIYPPNFTKILFKKKVADLAIVVQTLQNRYLLPDADLKHLRYEKDFFNQAADLIENWTDDDGEGYAPTLSNRYLGTVVAPVVRSVAQRLAKF